MIYMINLNFLNSFIDLCETLSFSKTARRLNTVQPVVSRQIRELETSLGYPLFIRTKKQVRLTDEGIQFRHTVGTLYSQLLASIESVSTEPVLQKILIKIGCTIEAGENLLYPIIKNILQENSSFQIQLSLTSTSEIVKKMADGEIDIGIVTRDPNLKGIISSDFYRERPVLIGSTQFYGTLQKLNEIKVVTYRENDLFTSEFIERNFSKGLRKKMQIAFTVNSHRIMIDFVKNHHAFAVIPATSAKELASSKSVKIYLEDKRGYTLKLLHRASLKQDTRKSKFLDLFLCSISRGV